MLPWLYNLSHLLAQVSPNEFDDKPDAPAAPAPHPLSFSDLQRGLRTASHGDSSDQRFKIALIIMVVIVVLIGLFLQLRQRRKDHLPANSTRKLAWELARKIRLPIDARLFLAWAAHTAKVPAAYLMISDRAFDRSVSAWANQPTFGIIRRLGNARLQRSRALLFEI